MIGRPRHSWFVRERPFVTAGIVTVGSIVDCSGRSLTLIVGSVAPVPLKESGWLCRMRRMREVGVALRAHWQVGRAIWCGVFLEVRSPIGAGSQRVSGSVLVVKAVVAGPGMSPVGSRTGQARGTAL